MKLAHVTINVMNMEESLYFYKEIVALNVVKEINQDSKRIVFLGEGETRVELIKDDSIKSDYIGHDIAIGFSVDNLEEKMEDMMKKDIRIHSGPFQPNPSTKFFYIEDPNGLKVQFIEWEDKSQDES